MVEALGLVRRSVIAVAALISVGIGWVLLWHVTPPGVASKLQTGVLATVVALQVLPVLAWFAWRADRSLSAAPQAAEPGAAQAAGRMAGTGESQPERAAERSGGVVERGAERPVEVLAVHRVVHVPRAKPGRLHGPHQVAETKRL